jgi:hypothetical protein
MVRAPSFKFCLTRAAWIMDTLEGERRAAPVVGYTSYNARSVQSLNSPTFRGGGDSLLLVPRIMMPVHQGEYLAGSSKSLTVGTEVPGMRCNYWHKLPTAKKFCTWVIPILVGLGRRSGGCSGH